MEGLCEGDNEPPGSLKTIMTRWYNDESSGDENSVVEQHGISPETTQDINFKQGTNTHIQSEMWLSSEYHTPPSTNVHSEI
ncbi:hypothetical protein ANN_24190 [Periplaneta americana]|uniref:Uncharacterized protein n=1 Tax=Periplaneta americana TaxID=6978 RepID=A0ABQ8S352_PERAM|nr:hypothetical protein ANN_24190 [Periplaneta americana]